MARSIETWTRQGVPQELAVKSARLRSLVHVLDISEICMQAGLELGAVGTVYCDLGERLKIDWLRDQIERLPLQGAWQERARIDAGDELAALHSELTVLVLKGLEQNRLRTSWIAAQVCFVMRSSTTIISSARSETRTGVILPW